MKIVKDYWLIGVLVFLFGGNLLQYLNPIIKVKKEVVTDTLKVVERDTLVEIKYNYLPSEIDTIGYYIYKTDTIYNQIIAKADTLLEEGTIEYLFPPINKFNIDLKPRIIYRDHYIKTETMIVSKPLFDFSHGIIAGAFATPDGKLHIGVGYGFKLGLNL